MVLPDRSGRERLRRCIVRSVGLLACAFAFVGFGLALAPSAFAAPYWLTDYTAPTPGSTAANTALVSAIAEDDVFPIVSGSMTINGFTVAPLVVDLSSPPYAILTFDPTQDGLLAYGTNDVEATVTNSNGDVSHYDWSFTVNTPPVVSAVTPAPSSVTTTTLKPPITVSLVDPDDSSFTPALNGNTAYFNVDGAYPASGVSYNAGTKTFTYQRPINWSDNSTHTVTFSAKDSAQNQVTTSWTFYIDTTTTVVFSGEVPAKNSTVTTSTVPLQFQVNSDDSRFTYDITNPYNSIWVDGVKTSTTATYPVPSDHTIMQLQSNEGALPDGPHTAQARVQDIWGLNATDTWSFNVEAPPAASNFAPYPATASLTPTISASIFDNGPGTASVIMKVDGSPVGSTYNPVSGVVSYKSTLLADSSDHTVTLVMTDAQSNTATQSWTFHVQSNSNATFSNLVPASSSTTSNAEPRVSVTATSAVNLDPTKTKLQIDSVTVTPTVTQPSPTQLNISGVDGVFLDGPHTAHVEVTDTNGYTSTYTWSFTIASPPTLTSPIPWPSTTTGSSRPPIGFWATDNDPGNLNVVLYVDGGQVYTGSVAQAVRSNTQAPSPTAFWYVPSADLSVGPHSVHADVTDAQGYTSSLDYTFTISDLGPMADAYDCRNCHQGYAVPNHPSPQVGDPCTECHTNPAVWTPSSPDPWQHDDAQLATAHATTTTGCSGTGCHDTSLITEHGKYPDGSGPKFQCVTCHDSKDPRVQNAIASGNTACTACHDMPTSGHEAVHNGGFPPTAICANCHNQNIAIQHSDNCPLCHASTDPLVVNAIATHNVTCSACHLATEHVLTGGINHSGQLDNSGNDLLGAHGAPNANPSAVSTAAIYFPWKASLMGNVGDNSPHGNYTTTTVKCVVCHAVHYAAPLAPAVPLATSRRQRQPAG